MNNRQESKLNMYRATESVCNANTSIFNTNVAFTQAFEEYQTKVAEVLSMTQQDALVITGIAIDKNVSKETLCNRTAEIGSVLSAYASTVGNNTLKSEVDFPVSKLMKLREELIAPNCQNIHDKAVEHLTDLTDYGINQTMLRALQVLINHYSAETPKTRAAISSRKATTANLAVLFDQIDIILKERMDKIVVLFRADAPEFVAAYENARRLVEPPTTTTQLKGIVTDKINGAPIKNVAVLARKIINGATVETFNAVTNSSGEYHIKPIINGTYEITFTAADYNPLAIDDFDIKRGCISRINAQMIV